MMRKVKRAVRTEAADCAHMWRWCRTDVPAFNPFIYRFSDVFFFVNYSTSFVITRCFALRKFGELNNRECVLIQCDLCVPFCFRWLSKRWKQQHAERWGAEDGRRRQRRLSAVSVSIVKLLSSYPLPLPALHYTNSQHIRWWRARGAIVAIQWNLRNASLRFIG